MDKSCHSSGDSTTITTNTTTTTSSSSNSTNNNSRDHYLKHLNKLSHRISKPTIIKKPNFDQNQNLNPHHHQGPPPPLPPSHPLPQNQNQSNLQVQQQHQPPVYNINKNDFRDVVQKLTGSPAHERFSTPPPIHAPKPQSSRLQRIRPPPLAHLTNRPPPLLNCANPTTATAGNINPHPLIPPATNNATASFIQRSSTPLSPLPPFPSVHAAAESPVSAYMRYLQNSIFTVDSNPKQFSGISPLAPLVSPRCHNLPPPQQQQPQQQSIPPTQQGILPSTTSGTIAPQPQFQLPTFGCLNSPRSPYPLLSPSLLFSPSSGQFGFPLSPTVPVPSPRWRGL